MATVKGFGMKNKPKICPHEDGYGTTSMDGIRCFLCNGTLDASQSSIITALELKGRIEKRLLECRTNSNKLSLKTQWNECKFQQRLIIELEKLLDVKK